MLVPNTENLEQNQKDAVCDFLNASGVNYMVIDHLPNHTLEEITQLIGIAKHTLLRATLLQDDEGIVLAILPLDYFLDIGQLSQYLGRELHALSEEKMKKIISGCGTDTCPPLPDFIGLDAIIENDIRSLAEVYFKPSTNNTLICMKRDAFMVFQQQSKIVNMGFPISQLSQSKKFEGGVSATIKKLTPLRIKQRVDQTIELPAVPVIAGQILKLRFNPHATSHDLAQIIEKDPSLSAQLMSWARSPYYGYAGKINSIESAIVKVLGFDLVMNLALGIVLGRSMQVSPDGPLGLREYWRFAICCAALVETLVKLMPVQKRPILGLAYLGGLLHNFGHLLLAQVFPPHFQLLNRYVVANPDVNIRQIEHYVLGAGHDLIGAWLMQSWQLPPEIIIAVRFHHQENYSNEYAVYPNLVLLATRLLKRHGLGDGDGTQLPQTLLDSLEISEEDACHALDYVMGQREDLFLLASQVSPPSA